MGWLPPRFCHVIIFYSQLFSTEDCIDKRFIRTNDRIRAREIRVIDDEGGADRNLAAL